MRQFLEPPKLCNLGAFFYVFRQRIQFLVQFWCGINIRTKITKPQITIYVCRLYSIHEQVYTELQGWGLYAAWGHADAPNLGLWIHTDVLPMWHESKCQMIVLHTSYYLI